MGTTWGNKAVFLKAILANRFHTYDEAFLESESHFQRGAEEALPLTEAELAEMGEEERNSLIEWYSEDFVKYKESLPRVLRNAYLIGYYSIYEYFLRYICAQIQQHNKIDIDLKIISGKGISQAMTYLEKICRIVDLGDHQWAEIKCINTIRNSLVHNLGRLKKGEVEKISQYIKKNSLYIDLDGSNRILIKDGYIQNVSKLFKGNLEGIINKAFLIEKDDR